MSSASRTPYGWTIAWRGLLGQRRTMRLATADEAYARARAAECESACRLLELKPSRADVARALEIQAITPAQAAALTAGDPIPAPRDPRRPLTLQAAALSHPSSQRDPLARQLEYCRYLDAFAAHAGIARVDQVTLDQVQSWLAEMVAAGLAWDTRRHRLLYLRRATRMGASSGIPDVLAGMRLDRREERPDVATWSLAQLARAAVAFAQLEDRRPLAALALGGFVGLRPSEICRVRVGDIEGDVLAVGTRKRKNRASRRNLPLPDIVLEHLAPLLAGRPDDAPLLATRSARTGGITKGQHFALHSYGHWLQPLLHDATGVDLPAKSLRASFATWATRHRIPTDVVESYLGHARHDVAAVTERHYLADAQVEQLRPHAATIDAAIRAAIAKVAPNEPTRE